jgi:hypothetical protein
MMMRMVMRMVMRMIVLLVMVKNHSDNLMLEKIELKALHFVTHEGNHQ